MKYQYSVELQPRTTDPRQSFFVCCITNHAKKLLSQINKKKLNIGEKIIRKEINLKK